MKSIGQIAFFELRVALSTKRALLVVGLYLAAALLASIGYVQFLAHVEAQVSAALVAAGENPQAATAMALLSELIRTEAYQTVLAFFAGTDVDAIAPSLKNSILLPALLWGSLAFLPILIVLTAFDSVALDVQTRSICYSTVRASRRSLFIGKLAAQWMVFAAVLVLSTAGLLAAAALSLESFSAAVDMLGAGRIVLLLASYGLCYIGVALFASASSRSPFAALILAAAILVVLRIFSFLGSIPPSSTWSALAYLKWLSPAHYHQGFWMAGWLGPAQSVVAYVLFALAFGALGVWQLERRNL